MMFKVSVITVCKNSAEDITATARSVIGQDYPDIEYIVIDGASVDNTLDVLDKCLGDYPAKIISEPDTGIYNAMNKGVDNATGDIICFLNSGDSFYDNTVVNRVVGYFEKKPADIVYGNIIYTYADGTESVRKYGKMCGTKLYYLTGDCINHQAVFARKECFTDNRFDESMSICADREWMMRMHKSGKKYMAIPYTICRYKLTGSGVSEQNSDLGWAEAEACIRRHFPHGMFVYKAFNRMRNGAGAERLHRIYEKLFIRKA